MAEKVKVIKLTQEQSHLLQEAIISARDREIDDIVQMVASAPDNSGSVETRIRTADVDAVFESCQKFIQYSYLLEAVVNETSK